MAAALLVDEFVNALPIGANAEWASQDQQQIERPPAIPLGHRRL
jgi:hypothetical protein